MGAVKRKGVRSSERFAGVPHWVLLDQRYRACSHPARALLLDLVMQYNNRNNGKLVLCDKFLKPLGWTSQDVVTRAKAALLKAGLLVETRKGARPNRAGWYALAWRPLDVVEGLDIDPRAYRPISQREINVLSPSHGVAAKQIAPSHGVRPLPPTPSHGAMQGV